MRAEDSGRERGSGVRRKRGGGMREGRREGRRNGTRREEGGREESREGDRGGWRGGRRNYLYDICSNTKDHTKVSKKN